VEPEWHLAGIVRSSGVHHLLRERVLDKTDSIMAEKDLAIDGACFYSRRGSDGVTSDIRDTTARGQRRLFLGRAVGLWLPRAALDCAIGTE
jgi:hypothetical protein